MHPPQRHPPRRSRPRGACPALGGALLCLCGLLLAQGPGVRAEELAETVSLNGKPRRLVVQYEGPRKPWARYVLTSAGAYMRAAAAYLDWPPGAAGDIVMVGREKVDLEGRWAGSYVQGNRVYLEYGLIRPGYPWQLFHALGHLWFGYVGYMEDKDQVAWFVEGVVSYLAIAMNSRTDGAGGALALPPRERGSILSGTLAGYRNPARDLPLYRDFRDDGGRELMLFWYNKTFKLQYVLYRELGAVKYRRWLQSFLRKARSRNGPPVLGLLQAQREANWKKLLSGWVFPGDYGPVAYGDFQDRDGDGMLDVDEHYAGTDPKNPDSDGDGIPDGAEQELALNPLQADPFTLVDELAPFMDGDPAEWEGLEAERHKDPAGDSRGGSALDLVEMTLWIRRGALHLMLRTDKPPVARPSTVFSVVVDNNGDSRFDRTFTFSLANPLVGWRYLGATRETDIFPGIRGGMGRVIEMRIPLELLGTARFRILPTIWDDKGKHALDAWNKWVPVRTDSGPVQ